MNSKPDFSTFDFPAELLKSAEQITLKDLLDTPFTQAWIISAISNAQGHSAAYPVEGNDAMLLGQLVNLVRKLPRNEREELFQQTSYLLQKNREERDRTVNKARAFRAMRPQIR